MSTIDIDNLPIDFQRDVTAWILKELRPFTFTTKEFPITIADALKLDMKGLPIAFQMWVYSLITPYEECSRLGGGIALSGNLKRAYLT